MIASREHKSRVKCRRIITFIGFITSTVAAVHLRHAEVNSGSRGFSLQTTRCEDAFVTFVSEEYLPGAVQLAYGWQRHWQIPRSIVFLVPSSLRDFDFWEEVLKKLCVKVIAAHPVSNPYMVEDVSLDERRFAKGDESVFMKLTSFSLLQFERILLADSDQIVFKSYEPILDDFELPAFAPLHFGNDTYFTSNIMTFIPSDTTYKRMMNTLGILPSYDRADQGFLNSFFQSEWNTTRKSHKEGGHRLPWFMVTWRRVIEKDPELWSKHKNKVLGMDCSGRMREKPWQPGWQEFSAYREAYMKWWDNYNAALYGEKQVHRVDRTSYSHLKTNLMRRRALRCACKL